MDAQIKENHDREVLKARFLSLYCMVLADETVDIRELETLYRIGRENYGLSVEDINSMVVDAGTSVTLYEKTEDKIKFLYQMAQIAWADGRIDESERNLLRKYVLRFNFLSENADGIVEFLLDKAHDNTPFADVLYEIENA